MLDWDDLRYFMALHRTGSLSGAARELRVNQTTVGRRLRELERTLEARLFDRRDRGFALAPAGDALLPHAQAVEEEILSTVMALSGGEAELKGSIRVTAPEAFGAKYLLPLMAPFLTRHPDIEIQFVADNRILNLSRREADLSIRFNRPSQSKLRIRQVAECGHGLYASHEYLARKPFRGLKAVAGHDLVGFDETIERWPEARWMAATLKGARVRCRVNTTHAILYAVEAGIGIGHLPCYMAEGNPRLVRLAGAKEVERVPIWLVLHEDLRPSARMRALIDFLVAELHRRREAIAGPDWGAGRRSTG